MHSTAMQIGEAKSVLSSGVTQFTPLPELGAEVPLGARWIYLASETGPVHILPGQDGVTVTQTTGMLIVPGTPVKLNVAGATHIAYMQSIDTVAGRLNIAALENA